MGGDGGHEGPSLLLLPREGGSSEWQKWMEVVPWRAQVTRETEPFEKWILSSHRNGHIHQLSRVEDQTWISVARAAWFLTKESKNALWRKDTFFSKWETEGSRAEDEVTAASFSPYKNQLPREQNPKLCSRKRKEWEAPRHGHRQGFQLLWK